MELAPEIEKDEIEETFDSPFEVALKEGQRAPAPLLAIDDDVNRSLRAIRYWEKEMARFEEQAKMRIGQIKMWLDAKRMVLGGKIAWQEEGLRSYLERSGKRKLAFLEGTIGWRKLTDKAMLQDEASFLKWAEEQAEAVRKVVTRVKASPDDKGVQSYVETTGEVPPGYEWRGGEVKFVANPHAGAGR